MSNKTKPAKTQENVKIQPPFLALIHIVLAFVLTWLIPLPLVVPPILQNAGFLLAILGFLLGMGALIAFRRVRTTIDPHRPMTRLVASGIYGFTRNPVYLGFLLMLIGIPLNGSSYWGILLSPVMVILFNRLVIEGEEEYLAQKFGAEYQSYKSRVRRWI